MAAKPTHFDVAVIGAGIAGLSVAHSAALAGFKTAVFDRKYPGAGASGAPKALLNPATGRKAKKSWNAEECLRCTRNLLSSVSRFTGDHFYTMNGIIRPALNKKLAEGMYRTYEETRWEEGWIEWADSASIGSRFPGLFNTYGGLWIPAGGTVAFGIFIGSFCKYLKHLGVEIYTGAGHGAGSSGAFGYKAGSIEDTGLASSDYSTGNSTTRPGSHSGSMYGNEWIESRTSPFRINSAGSKITADRLVYATGQAILKDPRWEMLALNGVKGQTLTVKLKRGLQFKSSVSSLGYIAQQGDSSLKIVLGSTYEHDFEHRRPDSQGAEYLLQKLDRTIPGIRNQVLKQQGWAGIRVTSSDKKPFIGKHPDIDHLYAIGALGSKGLMLGPRLGKMLTDLITGSRKVPDIFRIERLLR